MSPNAFDSIAWAVLVGSLLLLLFGFVFLGTAKDPGASKSGQGCVMAFALGLILLALLSGGCAVVVLNQK